MVAAVVLNPEEGTLSGFMVSWIDRRWHGIYRLLAQVLGTLTDLPVVQHVWAQTLIGGAPDFGWWHHARA